MAWPLVVVAVIALVIFALVIVTLPLAVYYSRRANQIQAERLHRALHEQTPTPEPPYTYEQRKIDRAQRIAKELEQFDERLKGRDSDAR
jgi:phage terminase Nu1 subunit (DNA packaging protein)